VFKLLDHLDEHDFDLTEWKHFLFEIEFVVHEQVDLVSNAHLLVVVEQILVDDAFEFVVGEGLDVVLHDPAHVMLDLEVDVLHLVVLFEHVVEVAVGPVVVHHEQHDDAERHHQLVRGQVVHGLDVVHLEVRQFGQQHQPPADLRTLRVDEQQQQEQLGEDVVEVVPVLLRVYAQTLQHQLHLDLQHITHCQLLTRVLPLQLHYPHQSQHIQTHL